jgi:AcrR family transcriptional regulator
MFGPFYPAPLQEVVNHAERLAELLRSGRLVPGPIDDWAAAWMAGREEEIERFLELTMSGRDKGKVDDATAAAVVAGYLASLHEGMARRLGLRRPACCDAGSEQTARPALGDAVTREVPAGHTPADPQSRTVRSVEDLLANLVDSWTEPEGGGKRA